MYRYIYMDSCGRIVYKCSMRCDYTKNKNRSTQLLQNGIEAQKTINECLILCSLLQFKDVLSFLLLFFFVFVANDDSINVETTLKQTDLMTFVGVLIFTAFSTLQYLQAKSELEFDRYVIYVSYVSNIHPTWMQCMCWMFALKSIYL